MQDYKQRRQSPRKPWSRPRLGAAARRRKPLPRGFKPLPSLPSATRRSPLPSLKWPGLAWPRFSALPPWKGVTAFVGSLAAFSLAFAYGAVLLWLVVGTAVNGRNLLEGPLERVRITGNKALTPMEVLDAAGLRAGQPMHDMDPIEVTRRLSAHPRVAASDVRRVFPGEAWIDVRERTGAMRVPTAKGEAILDESGLVILVGNLSGATHLPSVLGRQAPLVVGEAPDDPALTRARDFLRVAAAAGWSGDAFASVDASRPFMVSATLSSGQKAYFSTDGAGAELAALREILPLLPLSSARRGTYDARAASQVPGRIAIQP